MSWQDILKQNLQPFIDSVLAPEFKKMQRQVRVNVITDSEKYSVLQGSDYAQQKGIRLQGDSPEAQQLQSLTYRPVEVGTFTSKQFMRPIKVTGEKGKEFPDYGFINYIFKLKNDPRHQEPQQITQYVRRG